MIFKKIDEADFRCIDNTDLMYTIKDQNVNYIEEFCMLNGGSRFFNEYKIKQWEEILDENDKAIPIIETDVFNMHNMPVSENNNVNSISKRDYEFTFYSPLNKHQKCDAIAIIYDDIVDSGNQVQQFANLLKSQGYKEIYVASYIGRPDLVLENVTKSFHSIDYNDKWLIGYGLDHTTKSGHNLARNLDGLYYKYNVKDDDFEIYNLFKDLVKIQGQLKIQLGFYVRSEDFLNALQLLQTAEIENLQNQLEDFDSVLDFVERQLAIHNEEFVWMPE